MAKGTTSTGVEHRPSGLSIIAAQQTPEGAPDSGSTFRAIDPHSGHDIPTVYTVASAEEVDQASWAAWRAFHAMAAKTGDDRAALLEKIADEVLRLGEDL